MICNSPLPVAQLFTLKEFKLTMPLKGLHIVGLLLCLQLAEIVPAQETKAAWIRPAAATDRSIWGLRDGIVFGLWPYTLEANQTGFGGGPRGLIRVGLSYKGTIYHLNYIAIEPVVNGKIEFSEISNSKVDDHWGKMIWAADDSNRHSFQPTAMSRGVITHPDADHPEIEELSLYLFMEPFLHGAIPYFRLSVRSDRPAELGIQVFNRAGSSKMDQCAITATMGNYARLRKLYLKTDTIHAGELYKGFNDIDFMEKPAYPSSKMLRTNKGDYIAVAEGNENFRELSDWPQNDAYTKKVGWRYRPPFTVMQYWRRSADADPSLRIRVNGRATYWAGGSRDKSLYVKIPGGPAFENFELQEKYTANQLFYFGFAKGSVQQLIQSF